MDKAALCGAAALAVIVALNLVFGVASWREGERFVAACHIGMVALLAAVALRGVAV